MPGNRGFGQAAALLMLPCFICDEAVGTQLGHDFSLLAATRLSKLYKAYLAHIRASSHASRNTHPELTIESIEQP